MNATVENHILWTHETTNKYLKKLVAKNEMVSVHTYK